MTSRRILVGIFLAVSVLFGGGAAACERGGEGLACAKIVSPAFTPDGTLLLAWPVGERMMVARSKDGGRSFEGKPAAIVSKHGIFDMAEGRPAVAYEGSERQRGEVEDPHLARLYPSWADLADEPRFVAVTTQLYGLLAAWLATLVIEPLPDAVAPDDDDGSADD